VQAPSPSRVSAPAAFLAGLWSRRYHRSPLARSMPCCCSRRCSPSVTRRRWWRQFLVLSRPADGSRSRSRKAHAWPSRNRRACLAPTRSGSRRSPRCTRSSHAPVSSFAGRKTGAGHTAPWPSL